MNNQKIFKAYCIKTYKEKGLDGNKNNSNEKLYYIDIIFFKEKEEVYFKKEEDIYFIALKYKYLRDINYYNTEIIEINQHTFDTHFRLIK
jgi:hypothetical protein